MAGWQDAPIVGGGSSGATPAWQSAPIVGAGASPVPGYVPGQPTTPTRTAPADALGGGLQTYANNTIESLPIVGGPLKWLRQQEEQSLGVSPSEMQANEDTLNKANPLQQAAGQVTGSVAPYLVGGEIPAAAKLLGMDATMGLGARVGLGAASQAAISGADAATRGGDLGQIAGSTALGAVGGVAGPLIGKGVGAVADKLGGILPGMAQKSVVDAAVANAPDRAALRSAGSQLFQSSVDTNPVMLNGNSYLDMLDGIQSATKGYRPTIENNPEAIGLLKKLYSVADDITAPGSNTVVDLKDLHMLRMNANEVANSTSASPTTRKLGGIVVDKLDDYVNGLDSTDTLGGVNPTQDSKDLMNGISTWARASRVGLLEDAIKNADTYASGPTNGLKLSFLQLMKRSDFNQFSPVEQAAIRQVAKGTTTQNALGLIGKMGFSLGGGAGHNIMGGIGGAMLGGEALAPVFGPSAPLVAAGLESVGAGVARGMAKRIGFKNAQRAADIVATPGVPAGVTRPAYTGPNLAEQLARIGAQGATMTGSEALTGQPTAPNPYPVPAGISVSPAR